MRIGPEQSSCIQLFIQKAVFRPNYKLIGNSASILTSSGAQVLPLSILLAMNSLQGVCQSNILGLGLSGRPLEV